MKYIVCKTYTSAAGFNVCVCVFMYNILCFNWFYKNNNCKLML